MASKRVAPSAYAPSRCGTGTAFSTSRATDEVNGTTMTARINAADNMPSPNGGPLKKGSDFSDGGNEISKARTAGTRTKIPQRPYTIEGIAARSSVRNTSAGFTRFGASSEINTAMPREMGAAMRSARMDEYRVPQMNGSAPNSPATGSHVSVRQKFKPNF